MTSTKVLLSLCLVAVLAQGALGWWCTGHMLTVQIAMDNVDEDTQTQVDYYVGLFADYFPTTPTTVDSACWADEVKSQDTEYFNDWHYVDIAYNQTDGPVPEPGEDDQVVWLLENAVETLNSTVSNDWEKAFAIRFLLHMMGDIHQPLHCAELFSADFPDGDLGGNYFYVYVDNDETNLHSYWDSAADQYSQDFDLPLSASDAAYIASEAKNLESEYPESEDNLGAIDFTTWSQESYDLAVNVAYDCEENEDLSQEYIDTAMNTTTYQIALGGYRLAAVLDSLTFPPSPDTADSFGETLRKKAARVN